MWMTSRKGGPEIATPAKFRDFDILVDSETDEAVQDCNIALRMFLRSTWIGNSGARRAEMMASTLAAGGRDVGRFCALPDRSDGGKITRDIAFCYFMGLEESGG